MWFIMISFTNDNKLIIAVLLILILSQIKLFQCLLLKWTKEYKVRQVQESASLKVKKAPIEWMSANKGSSVDRRDKYNGNKNVHK